MTALYELVPVGAAAEAAAGCGVEPLKYQESGARSQEPEVRDGRLGLPTATPD